MSLFDVDPYTTGKPRARRARRTPTPGRTTLPGVWHVIATTAGPVRYVHVLDKRQPPQLVIVGSVLTRCNIVGRIVETIGVDVDVHPCPECHLSTSL